MVNTKSETKKIDEFVAESLRIIGLSDTSGASIPNLPSSPHDPSAAEENVPVFKMTIGDASR